MKPEDIKEILNKLGTEDVPADASRIAREISKDFSETLMRQRKHILMEYIMESRITKLAVAAAIIVAVLIGLHFVGNPLAPTLTWAEVIQPILNAQTAILDIIVGEEDAGGPVIHDMIMGARIRRTMSGMEDVVSIIDLEAGRILSLSVSKKEAAYIDLEGLPSMPNYMETLRNIITELQDNPDFVVEELGEQEIQGRKVIGFRATHQKVEITIWADPETALPVRMEQVGGQMQVICKNLEFDIPMDESLFSMDVPEEYTLQQVELDLLGATEQDFIEGLRIRAEVFGDGWFPEGVAVEDYIRQAPAIVKKIDELGLSDEEATELGMKLSRHLLFIRFFKGEGKWQYAGKDVKLGDADTHIFWYRPEDSETYRVIYGDLHVEDVAPESLPESIPAEQTAEVSIVYQQWSKSEFTGTQEDLWYIEASGDISVRSDLTLLKGPEGTNVIPISLPYADGKLTSVTLDEVAVPFRQMDTGRYELELPLEKIFTGQTKIRCKWTLSLDVLEKVDKVDYGYRTVLKSLIPVVSYRLRVSLAPDCGFEFTKDTSKEWIVPFTFNAPKPHDHFGSCGIQIRKRD